MKKVDHYPASNVAIKFLRDFILDHHLTEKDSIILNTVNFDDIILEYRDTYNVSITIPFYLLGVEIKEDRDQIIPTGRLGVIVNDPDRFENDYNNVNDQPDESYSDTLIYRCGYCGKIVDEDGSILDFQTERFKEKILEKFRYTVIIRKVYGKCCVKGF